MEDKKLHAMVELLLARMESNPEEFTLEEDRWGYPITTVEEYGSPEDTAALKKKLRGIRLDEAHKWMMDELLNGEERRRGEREMMQQQAMRISANGSVGIGNTTPSNTLGVTLARHPTFTDMERSGIMNALRNVK